MAGVYDVVKRIADHLANGIHTLAQPSDWNTTANKPASFTPATHGNAAHSSTFVTTLDISSHNNNDVHIQAQPPQAHGDAAHSVAYEKTSNKNAANGYIGANASGLIDNSRTAKIASANVRNSHDADATTSNASYTLLKTITVNQRLKGTIRIHHERYNDGSGGNCYSRIYKNGVAFGMEQSGGNNSWYVYDEDLAVDMAAGETLQVYGYKQAGTLVRVRNFRLEYDTDMSNGTTISVTNS